MRMRGEEAQHRSIVGTFKDRVRFERAVQDLKNRGFHGDDITVSMKDAGEADRLSKSLGIIDAKAAPKWLSNSNMLLGVECGDRCDEASRVLTDAGATDIRWARIRMAEEAMPARPAERGLERGAAEAETIPVREEELSTHRERRQGEVEITKHVVEEQRTMRVPVTHEEVEIERRHVDQPADRSPQEGTVTIPVYEEEIVLEKRPRLVEEIRVTKRPVTEEREVKGTIRKEVPEIKTKGQAEKRNIKELR